MKLWIILLSLFILGVVSMGAMSASISSDVPEISSIREISQKSAYTNELPSQVTYTVNVGANTERVALVVPELGFFRTKNTVSDSDVRFMIDVPVGTQPGSYVVRVVAYSGDGKQKVTHRVLNLY